MSGTVSREAFGRILFRSNSYCPPDFYRVVGFTAKMAIIEDVPTASTYAPAPHGGGHGRIDRAWLEKHRLPDVPLTKTPPDCYRVKLECDEEDGSFSCRIPGEHGERSRAIELINNDLSEVYYWCEY